MAKKQYSATDPETRNRGLEKSEEALRDPNRRPPQRAAEQAAPEPERSTTPDEHAEQDSAHLENPPQVEGPRERNNDAV